MTRVLVNSGICGFSTTITATMLEDKKTVSISLDSQCEMAQKMSPDLKALDKMSVFTGFLLNPVYKSANTHLRHTACPVPSGILKAIEAEAGLCLPRDASIVFVNE